MNCPGCKQLENRMKEIEASQAIIIPIMPSILRLVELLENVESALRVFVKIGNGLKWLAFLISSVIGAIIAIRKWV